jgi:hypothetical protein
MCTSIYCDSLYMSVCVSVYMCVRVCMCVCVCVCVCWYMSVAKRVAEEQEAELGDRVE